MTNQFSIRWLMFAAWLSGTAASVALAQDATLPKPVQPPAPKNAQQSEAQLYHTLHDSSFIFRKIPPEAEARELQIHDIITVLVDYRASMTSEGDAERRSACLPSKG